VVHKFEKDSRIAIKSAKIIPYSTKKHAIVISVIIREGNVLNFTLDSKIVFSGEFGLKYTLMFFCEGFLEISSDYKSKA